jgi:type II secretory pathway pseudopilin PulG
MQLPVKRRNFRFLASSSHGSLRKSGKAGDQGYVLLLVMMMVVILLVSLTAALPSIYTEAQREKEKELIFRGTQYARAVYLFHQQFHRYPASVKELLHTNDLSFLRRAYPDPMSKDGKWRFIHATASGIILDSENITVKNPLQPGQGSTFGHSSEGSNAGGSTDSSSQQSGQQETTGFQGSSNPFHAGGEPGSNSSSTEGQQQGESAQTNSNPFGQGQMIGSYIVGVASASHQASIRVYNDHKHYNKWEFLGVPGVPGSVVQLPILVPGLTSQPQQGTSNPTPQTPTTPSPNPPGGGPSNP